MNIIVTLFHGNYLHKKNEQKLEYIGMDDNGELILDDLDKYLATGKVKLCYF